MDQKLAQVLRLGQSDMVVHGVLIGAVFALFYGAIELSRALGRDRPSATIGLMLYANGCIFLCGAMLLDGFVTPQLARALLAAGERFSDAAGASCMLVSSCIQVLTKTGLVVMGAGMACWSAACRGGPVALMILGVVAGFLPPMLAILFGIRMDPHSLMLLVGAHGAWNLTAALFLWRTSRVPPGCNSGN
jgi:hypothetical protein